MENEKKVLIERIKKLSWQQVITEQELLTAFNEGKLASNQEYPITRKVTPIAIFNFIGGLIFFLGFVILVGENWDAFSTFFRVFFTLGIGIGAFCISLYLCAKKRAFLLTQSLFLIGNLITPVGIAVLYNCLHIHLGLDPNGALVLFSIFIIVSLLNAILYKYYKYHIFFFFLLLFLTLSYLFGCENIIGSYMISWLSYINMYAIATIILGGFYLLVGLKYKRSTSIFYTPSMFLISSICILTASFFIDGLNLNQPVISNWIYPLVCFCFIWLSIKLQSKVFLFLGSIYFMIYILKITSEYFNIGIVWPIALILTGILFIGIGYASLYINKRFIKIQKNQFNGKIENETN